jgi:DNA-binding response OmpR family regulator
VADSHDIDALLLATLAPRLRPLSQLATPEAHGPAAVAVARSALESASDVPVAIAGVATGKVESICLEAILRRAARLLGPVLQSTQGQVVFDTAAERTMIEADEGGLLRFFVLVMRDLLVTTGQPVTLTVATSLMGSAALVWLSTQGPSASGASVTSGDDVLTMIRRLGLEVEPSASAGPWPGRALRISLPCAPRAVATIKPSLRVVTHDRVATGRPALHTSGATTAPGTRASPSAQGREATVSGAPVPVSGAPVPVSGAASPGAARAAACAALPLPETTATGLGTPVRSMARQRAIDELASRAADALAAFHAFVPARRVLVVDDEQNITGLFAALLPSSGIDFAVAGTAAEALAAMKPGHFSLAILDKNLPDQSGLELLGLLRATDPNLGAVLMTAYSSARSLSAALDRGVYDYIEKPFPDVVELIDRIEIALRRHGLHTRVTRLAERVSALATALPADVAALDPHLARARELLTTVGTSSLSVLVLATRDVAETLIEPLSPLTGVHVSATVSAEQARTILGGSSRPDCLVVEPAAWDRDMASLLAACSAGTGPATRVYTATRDESLGPAISALTAGVDDYLLLGESTPEQLRRRLRNGLSRLRLRQRDRAVLLELLGVDIDRMAPPAPRHDGPPAGGDP